MTWARGIIVGTEQTAALVKQAQQGDVTAFATLYETFTPHVRGYLRRRHDGSDETIDDLTAEVFMKLYEKLDRYVERGLPFTAWLYRIAHNCLIDYVRKLPRQTATSLDEVVDVQERDSGVEYGQVLDRNVLEPAMERLTQEQRQTIECRFLKGRSVAETAAAMSRSEEAVKKLQARALMSLRRILLSNQSLGAAPRAATRAA
jgi:RNA polymerase sigma-70 factor (ECF subfamily)